MRSELKFSSHGGAFFVSLFTSLFLFEVILHFFLRFIRVDRVSFFFLRHAWLLPKPRTERSIEIIFKRTQSSIFLWVSSVIFLISKIWALLNTRYLRHLHFIHPVVWLMNILVISKPWLIPGLLGCPHCRISPLHHVSWWGSSHALLAPCLQYYLLMVCLLVLNHLILLIQLVLVNQLLSVLYFFLKSKSELHWYWDVTRARYPDEPSQWIIAFR